MSKRVIISSTDPDRAQRFTQTSEDSNLWMHEFGTGDKLGFFLEKETKRGWTFACYRVRGLRVEFFLDRKYWFEMSEE